MKKSALILGLSLLLFISIPVVVVQAATDTAAPAASGDTGAAPTNSGTGVQQGSGGFVPLTSLPGIKDFSGSSNLPDLLNNLYRILIGAAAVLAVLQIMRAGILYMGGDSVTEKKEAKNLLAMSIGGLLLVLSPYIIFTVINPGILKLKIGDIVLPPFSSDVDQFANDSNPAAAKATCSQYSGNNLKSIPDPQNKQSCSSLGAGWDHTPDSCCSGLSAGSICCGYSATNKGSGGNDAAFNPNLGTGSYSLEVLQLDSINKCYAYITNKYPTADSCNKAQHSVVSGQVLTKDCTGKSIPLSTDLKNAISSMSVCPQ